MKVKYNLFLAIAFASIPWIEASQAAEIVGDVTAVVEKASCTLVAKESTTGSTLVGGGLGAVGGAVVGRLAGGKKGTGWGALAGAAVGAYMGANSGDETYHCRLMVDADGERRLLETPSDKEIEAGDTINLIRTSDGKLTVM